MFFHISKSIQNNFSHNHQTANFVISLDEGWSYTKDLRNNDIWYKGYLDYGRLDDHILDIATEEAPTRPGNFCVIKVFDSGVIIRTDTLRSFPLWYHHNDGLTNLKNIGDTYWSDSYVMLNNNLSILHSKFDAVGPILTDPLTFDEVVNETDRILTLKTKQFLENLNDPIRVFLSGGIDTTLLYSYIKKHTTNFEIIAYTHCDFDYFYLKNSEALSKLWGYNQIHHWKEPCILASGAPGDEFTGRNPVTVDLLLRHHGTSFVETMEDSMYKEKSLNYTFFKNSYLEKMSKKSNEYNTSSLEEVIRKTCEYNINDWQHWHLGNTLTWTPFRDLEMFKLFARLSVDDLNKQMMCSAVQIELIRRSSPELLPGLANQKNSGNCLENLTNILVDF